MSFITKNINRFKYAGAGILFATKTDHSFRVQLYVVGAFIIGVLLLFAPLNAHEALFVILSYFLILITELQNSAFEAALDHLHPELHHNIGRSKDMAAGAVLLAALFLCIVIGFLVFGRVF